METEPIELAKPCLGEEEYGAVRDVLESGWLTHGSYNEEFEARFAEYIGVESAVSVNSCTSALQLALEALGVEGEVLLPSFTFVASANAVVNAGAIPRFVDVDPSTGCVDASRLRSAVGPGTEAIMPVHYAGQCADMTAVQEIADSNDLHVIEDSAECLGGTHRGRKAGSFGVGCFSFFPTKNITTGEGGMITTDDVGLSRTLRSLIGHGIETTTAEREESAQPWYRSASRAGYNFRMSNMQAALGVAQMSRVDAFNDKRRALAERYDGAFSEVSEITPLGEAEDNYHVYQMYVVRLDGGMSREGFVEALRERGVEASVHFYPPVHLMPRYDDPDYRAGDLHRTEELSRRVVTLPMHPGLEPADVDRAAREAKSILAAGRG